MDQINTLIAHLEAVKLQFTAVESVMRDLQQSEIRLQTKVDQLQAIIDSRPALNANLVQSYTKWTHMIYAMEMHHIMKARKEH